MDFSLPFAASAMPNFFSSAPAEGGLKEWLVSGSYRIRPIADGWELFDIIDSDMTPYVLADYARFAFASYESIVASYQTYFDTKALAWPNIKRYYAGFFAAHAITRSQGRGVVRLESPQTTHLNLLTQATHSSAQKVDAGTFELEFISAAPRGSTLKLRGRKKTAVHEDFWSFFDQFLKDYALTLATSNNTIAPDFIRRLLEFQGLLCAPKKKGPNGLSALRNAINYQQQYGVWYPFKKSLMVDAPQKKGRPVGPQFQMLRQTNASISLSHDPSAAPLTSFLTAVSFLALVNIDLVKQFRGRYPASSQFFKDWDKLAGLMAAPRAAA